MKTTELTINGLKTYLLHYPGVQSASTQIWFRAGSSLESKEDQGIAHFLEHMFFKGTKKRPGSKIAKEIESFGGDVNAFTSFDYTCYYINSPKDCLNKSIDILMDMVSHPLFDAKELVPERDVVLEEYKRSIDNPSHFHFHHIQKNSLSPGYSHPILGFPKTIQNFTRKQIVQFRKKFYNTSNAALVIAADLNNTKQVENIIAKYKLPSGPKSEFKSFKVKSSPKKSVHINKKDVKQLSLSLLFNAPAFESPKAAAEDLAVNCLGHGESSYLHQTLVKESGLASHTSGSTMFMAKGGAHFIKLVFPENKIKEVLTLFTETVQKVLNNGFDEKDLIKIKNQYVASKIYEQETIDSLAFSIGHGFAQNGDIHSDRLFIEGIKNTQLIDVNEALGKVFEASPQIHLQAPLESKEEPLRKELEKFSKNLSKLKVKNKKASLTKGPSKFDPQVKTIEVKKGIKLIYRHNPMVPTFSLHAYLKGGLSTETKSNAGTHYQLANNFTYGHVNKEYKVLRNDLDTLASSLSGFSGKNAYGLTMHGLSEHFDVLSDDFFYTLLKPTFPEYYLEREKDLLLRSLEEGKKNPTKQCFKKFQRNLFKGTPYELDITGDEETLKTMTSDVLSKTHQHNLKNSEILFTYCGDHSLSKVIALCEEFCKNLPERKVSQFKQFKISVPKNSQHHIEFDREQTQVFIGQNGLALEDNSDVYLKILTSYLSGQSSELFVKVRDEMGLCYACQPVHHTALQAGYWGIYIGTSFEKTDLAIKAINDLLQKIADKGFKGSDLNRVKKMISGNLKLQLQSNEDYANFYSIPFLHNLSLDFEYQRIQKINEVKLEDLNKFLNKFLNKKKIIVTAGKKA